MSTMGLEILIPRCKKPIPGSMRSWRSLAGRINDERIDPEKVVRAVFRVLSRRVTAGEIADVKHLLPAALRELWPAK